MNKEIYEEYGKFASQIVQDVENNRLTSEDAQERLNLEWKKLSSPKVKKLRANKKTVFKMCPDKLAEGLDKFGKKK